MSSIFDKSEIIKVLKHFGNTQFKEKDSLQLLVELMGYYYANKKPLLMTVFTKKLRTLQYINTQPLPKEIFFMIYAVDDPFYRILFELVANSLQKQEIRSLEEAIKLRNVYSCFQRYLSQIYPPNKYIETIHSALDEIMIQDEEIVQYLNRTKNLSIYQTSKPTKVQEDSYDKKKVFFVVGYVPISDKGAHINLTVLTAAHFARQNPQYDVELLITGENSLHYHEFVGLFGTTAQFIDLEYFNRFHEFIDKSANGDLFSKNLTLTVIRESDIRNIYSYVKESNPYFMFFWSGFTGSSLLQKLSKNITKTGLLFFNYLDKYNAADYDLILHRKKRKGVQFNKKNVYLPFPESNSFDKFPSDENFTVSDLKRYEDEKIVLTVLAGDRIGKVFSEYSGHILNAYFDLLNNTSGVRHIIIGYDDEAALRKIDDRFGKAFDEHKITLMKKVDNLKDYYKYADLMLHFPNFIGGGGGVALARECDLPVLCFENSDAAASQAPRYLYTKEHIHDFFADARMLLTEHEKRVVAAQELKKYQNRHSPEASSITLAEKMEIVIHNKPEQNISAE